MSILKINRYLLKNRKNLLAFSAGIDSTALFFLLLENGIDFDIAIVNYGLREQAKEELSYAKELSIKYNKRCFATDAPKFNSNFEANARVFRYNFFVDIITSNAYDNLLTAHQLNDKLEWLLMRLSLGAGCAELSGLEEITKRENYILIRPLLNYTKDELLEYLQNKEIKYFIDRSNFDTKYRRNQYRPLVDKLLKIGNKSGFNKSFEILKEESEVFKNSYKIVFKKKSLRVLELSNRQALPYAVSYTLKELGYLLGGKEREVLRHKESIVVGRKWAIEYSNSFVYICPYLECSMPKDIKESFRVDKIPPKARCYIYKEKIDYKEIFWKIGF